MGKGLGWGGAVRRRGIITISLETGQARASSRMRQVSLAQGGLEGKNALKYISTNRNAVKQGTARRDLKKVLVEVFEL